MSSTLDNLDYLLKSWGKIESNEVKKNNKTCPFVPNESMVTYSNSRQLWNVLYLYCTYFFCVGSLPYKLKNELFYFVHITGNDYMCLLICFLIYNLFFEWLSCIVFYSFSLFVCGSILTQTKLYALHFNFFFSWLIYYIW